MGDARRATGRRWSWFLGACAYGVPTAWAYYAIGQAYPADSQTVVRCGLAYFAILAVASLGAGILSLASTGLNVWARWPDAAPIRATRVLEFALLGVPLVVTIVLWLGIAVG